MGIQLEFNPDLALRKFGAKDRHLEECFPEKIEAGKVYPFFKHGQRNYWLEGEIPLLETKGEGQLSRPLASITILEATHFSFHGEVCTKGKYKVIEIFDTKSNQIHFEGMNKIK